MIRKIFLFKELNYAICLIIILLYCLNAISQSFDYSILDVKSIYTTETNDTIFNGTFNNISLINEGASFELRLKRFESCSWNYKTPLTNPDERGDHAMAPIYGTNKVVMYGGYNMWTRFNDTWIYDLANNSWNNKYPFISPGPRDASAMASIWGEDKVIIFGGASETVPGSNDTWVYDLSDNNWSRLYPPVKPLGRTGHKIASFFGTDKILLYGGYKINNQNQSILNKETWIYDYSDNNWINVTNNPSPDIRNEFSLTTIHQTDKILLFGGRTPGSVYLNDTWIFNLRNLTWTKMRLNNAPDPRIYPALAAIPDSDKVILFSGPTGGSPFKNDTWIYDLSDNIWIKKSSMISPDWKQWHRMSGIFGSNKVLLFGGGDPISNETWLFTFYNYFPEGNYTSLPIFTNYNVTYKSLKWNGLNTINTNLEFQLRTGQTESELKSKIFVGPGGNRNDYYSVSNSTIWKGHDDDSWIQYKAFFYTSNYNETPILKNVTIEYNNWPIASLKQPIDGCYLNNNRPLFKWNFSDIDSTLQSEFQLVIDDNSEFLNIDFDSGEQITNNSYWQFPNGTNYSKLSDGYWYWKVRTKDNDGDWGLNSTPYKLIIDTGIPSTKIIKPKDNTFYGFIDVISGIANDPPNGIGLKKVEIKIEDLNLKKFWDGSTWTSSENWLISNGKEVWSYDASNIEWNSGTTCRIHSRAVDIAGNIESPAQMKKFTFDDEGVIFSVPIPEIHQISNQEEVQVGITISDNTSGVNASTIKYSISTDAGNYWGPWKSLEGFQNGNNVDVKLNLTFPNGTGNRIRWRAYDIAGNGPTYSDEYIINVNIPTTLVIPVIKLVSPLNNSIITTTTVELSWEAINNFHPNIVFDIKLGTQNPTQDVIEQNYANTNYFVDQLENGQTYYWTVIPKLNNINGTCISGIWSFTIDIPLPRAILKTPENNSIMTSTLPTLVWSLEYKGSESISYNIFFGTNKDPPLKQEKISTTYFAIDTALLDNTSYYWKIIPWVGEYEGLSSEVWSFTVKLKDETTPTFGIELILNPNPLEIKPGEVKFISAIVTNLGELNDNFTFSIGKINGMDLTAEVYREDILEIAPGKNKEFLIMVSVEENIKPGFENITITAKSKLAEKYNLDIQDSNVLTIKILEKDEQKGKDRAQPISIFYFSILLIIVILIIIAIIILILVRKKSSKKDSEIEENQDIRPETTSESIPTFEPESVHIQQQDETLEE
jgi:hypothetical protein